LKDEAAKGVRKAVSEDTTTTILRSVSSKLLPFPHIARDKNLT
jgi:hypothetical protein